MLNLSQDIASILCDAQYPAVLCSFGSDSTLLLHYARQARRDIPAYYFGDSLPELAEQLVINDDLTVLSYAPADRYLVPQGDGLALIDEYDFNGRRVPMVSPVKTHAKTNMQQARLQRTASESENETILSRASRGVYAQLATNPSVDARAAPQGQRAQQGGSLQEARTTGTSSLRGLWHDGEGRDAPRRLRLPADRGVDVSSVSSSGTQAADLKNCAGHAQVQPRTASFHFPHDLILWGYRSEDRHELIGTTFERDIALGHTRFIAPLYDLTTDQVLNALDALGLDYVTDDAVELCDECLNTITNGNWDRNAALAGFHSRFNYSH